MVHTPRHRKEEEERARGSTKITAEESVKARTSKDRFILKQTKRREQINRDIETARAIFGDPKLGGVTQAEKIRTVGDLPTGFQQVESAEEIPRIRDPRETAERFFQARQESIQGVDPSTGRRTATLPSETGGVQEELGTQELIGELQEKIDEPPELETDFKEQRATQVEQNREFAVKLFSGKATSGEIIAEAKKVAVAGAVVGGVAAGLIFAAPLVAATAVRVVIGKVVASQVGKLAIAAAGIFIGGKLTDLNRGEISTSRKIIQGMVEEGERIEADVRNGLDPGFAVDRLSTMADEIENAESAIKLATIYNIKYRLDKESLADQQSIIKAREAIRRRLRAVENIAVTGTAALNPEALLMSISQR